MEVVGIDPKYGNVNSSVGMSTCCNPFCFLLSVVHFNFYIYVAG